MMIINYPCPCRGVSQATLDQYLSVEIIEISKFAIFRNYIK